MPGKLTWNGVPLLIPDPDGELERWFSQFHRIQDLVAFCSTETAQISSNNAPRSNAGTGITTPNYPDLPPLVLNQLIWPTGATRFGYFVGLVPGSEPAVGAQGSTGSLILSDGMSTITASMELLAYWPIAEKGTSPLWMIVLVDRRYSWQFKNCGNIITASGFPMLDTSGTYDGTPNNDYGQLQITYLQVFTAIETAIGTEVNRSPVQAPLYPDPLELVNRKNFNVAQMLDAVAESCGLRVFLDFDGSVSANSPLTSVSYTENFNDVTNLIAGGTTGTSSQRPKTITVNFRRASQYRAYADNDVYSITTTNSAGDDGVGLVVESCAYAHWLALPDNYVNPPDNLDNLNSLASSIAAGIRAWSGVPYDATFDGVKNWQPTGWDNYVEFTYAAQVQNDSNDVPLSAAMAPLDGERFDINYYRFTTRAQSMPANFGSYINLSQDPSIRFLRGMQWGKLTADAKQPIDGTTPQAVAVNIWQLDSKFAEHDTGIQIQAFDVSLSIDTLTKGTRVYLWFHEVNRMWVLERMGDEPDIVRVTGTSSVANMAQKNPMCLWGGNVVSYNLEYPPCSGSQFQPKGAIWIAIINNDGEVTNFLPSGDRYLGSPVGTYAVGDDSRPLYLIRADHHLIRFQLIAPMQCGVETAASNAVQLYWTGTEYAISSQVVTVVDPYIADGGMFEGLAQTPYQIGYRGYAEWKPDRRVYEVVFMQRPAQWIRFQIYSGGQILELGSASVRARVLSFWGGKSPDPQNVGILVYQLAGNTTGIFVAPSNAIGLAVYDDYQNRYDIVFVQNKPRFIAGTLATALTEGDATGVVAAQWDSLGFVPLTGNVDLVDKSNIFTGAIGKKFQATYDAATDSYALTWVECSAA